MTRRARRLPAALASSATGSAARSRRCLETRELDDRCGCSTAATRPTRSTSLVDGALRSAARAETLGARPGRGDRRAGCSSSVGATCEAPRATPRRRLRSLTPRGLPALARGSSVPGSSLRLQEVRSCAASPERSRASRTWRVDSPAPSDARAFLTLVSRTAHASHRALPVASSAPGRRCAHAHGDAMTDESATPTAFRSATRLTFDDVLLVPGRLVGAPERRRPVRAAHAAHPHARCRCVSVADGHRHRAPHGHLHGPGGRASAFIHKNLSIAAQAAEVAKVKRFESGMIVDPITLEPEQPISRGARDHERAPDLRPAGGARREARRHPHQPRPALREATSAARSTTVMTARGPDHRAARRHARARQGAPAREPHREAAGRRRRTATCAA